MQSFLKEIFRVGISPFYARLFLPFYVYVYVYIYEQKPPKAILLDHLETFFILSVFRSGRPAVFLGKSVLKICSKFTGEHPYRSVISATFLKSHFGIGKFAAYFQNTFS